MPDVQNLDALRGLEGQAASCYFSAFGRMIARDKAEFAFAVRTRRSFRNLAVGRVLLQENTGANKRPINIVLHAPAP